MNFKNLLDKDLDTTFYNSGEFAEIRKIRYDGKNFKIPVVFDLEEDKERKITANDNAEGIHQNITTIRIKLKDFKKEPRNGARFFIDDDLYIVIDCKTVYNELVVSLERFDE